MMTRFIIILISLFSISLSINAQGILNKKAPKWDIEYWIDGKGEPASFEIDDYKGEVLYIMCFQDWCPGCHTIGFPMLQYLTDKFKNSGDVNFVCIQTVFEGKRVNTKKKLRKTQKKYELKIPFGHNSVSGKRKLPSFMKDYKTNGTPWVIIVDKKGVVRYNNFDIKPKFAVDLIRSLKKE